MTLFKFIGVIGLSLFLTAHAISLSKASIGILLFSLSSLLALVILFAKGFDAFIFYGCIFVIISLQFPFLIQVLGRDAVTVTSLLILLLYFSGVLAKLAGVRLPAIRSGKTNIVLWGLAGSMTISLLLTPVQIGQSIRHYLSNITGIFLFFIISQVIRTKADLLQILKLPIIISSIQALICVAQLTVPGFGPAMAFLGTRNYIPAYSVAEGLRRATGTIWDYELLAQWFLIGVLLSMLFSVLENKKIYYVSFAISLMGIALTKTRSDLILFLIMYTLCWIYLSRLKLTGKFIGFTMVILGGALVGYVISPGLAGDILTRMHLVLTENSGGFSESLNRKDVWQNAMSLIHGNISLFGNGFFTVETVFSRASSFHSLYLSLLYKVGALGLLLHLFFWLILIRSLLTALFKASHEDIGIIRFFLLICTIVILCDGFKIEYLRYSHTTQYAWVIFGLAYSSLRLSMHEDSLVSKTSDRRR